MTCELCQLPASDLFVSEAGVDPLCGAHAEAARSQIRYYHLTAAVYPLTPATP